MNPASCISFKPCDYVSTRIASSDATQRTYQGEIQEYLEDAKVIQATIEPFPRVEILQTSVLAELRLDVQVIILFPVSKILDNVLSILQGLKYQCFLEFPRPIHLSTVRVLGSLDNRNSIPYRGLTRILFSDWSRGSRRARSTTMFLHTIDMRELAVTNLGHVVKLSLQARLDIDI
jgi:hypothetical protein